MSKVYLGCPTCGSPNVKAKVNLEGVMLGKFDEGGEFQAEEEDRAEDILINDIDSYECAECEEEFDSPCPIYNEEGPRMRIKLSMELVHTKSVKHALNEDYEGGKDGSRTTYYAVDDEKPESSKSFSVDIPIGTFEAGLGVMEAGKAFFHAMLIKQGAK